MGSALALQGADLLARAIAEHRSDVPRALASYEAAIQPLNARYQESGGKMRGFILGRSRVRAAVRNVALSWMPDAVMIRQARRFYGAENATAALT
ncbi:hypothetical protein [Hyalangium gracile]|uniref:hypothetical protein n=1 Tax=Hyalangium gracile TaxID=394092 RepID=UPI001CCBAA1D|nr:hypothetical protein [Hyalangium gracile]